ncbi:hypothetical protein A3F29_01555 [Candidatus Roizmanbacteria bacterium RIFCSPHIGHO2_12_FULL_33_9]|uniref:Uncharacterized protein n=1 Tax=Candidatus Roizmanbacteria bacterium RIFCSPHIGHO2_12_FULL_33_9 TaxID=1802045 RepID=A0A1F7HK76_9BACT|nr:MAG: hypothetical protein A3F29_01555 [Candidatus Roizmanbacteria bacterium RIFCSPHIGHO2_12_FULL_33_9]
MKKKRNKIDIKILLIIILSIINIAFIILAFKNNDIKLFNGLKEKFVSVQRGKLFEEINPSSGYSLGIKFGILGPKMLDLGVIDFDKFNNLYKDNNPLTDEQIKILKEGSSKEVKITKENSHFLLNFFWAVGLANKTKILDEGDMVKYSEGSAGNFASTGGWSLGKSDAMEYYSNNLLIPLTEEQEELVFEVSSNIYRPCCGNPTSFPDCNHGMALLGVLELMASQGASEEEMYMAAKYINAFWFPSNYYDLANYFEAKEGKKFSEIDGKIILGRDYSSATGYANTKKWLTENGLVEKPLNEGSSCGV